MTGQWTVNRALSIIIFSKKRTNSFLAGQGERQDETDYITACIVFVSLRIGGEIQGACSYAANGMEQLEYIRDESR
jgi:hypothetical protein